MARGRGREEVVSSKYINLVLFKPRLPQSILPSTLPSLYSTRVCPHPSPTSEQRELSFLPYLKPSFGKGWGNTA